jgi:hypothetical protein
VPEWPGKLQQALGKMDKASGIVLAAALASARPVSNILPRLGPRSARSPRRSLSYRRGRYRHGFKDLCAAYEAYRQRGDPQVLLDAVQEVGAEAPEEVQSPSEGTRGLTEEDLHLVCWEYIWS